MDELVLELEQLERREREISAHRSKIFDRLASFPNEITQRKEREVSAERRALHKRIDELRAQLALLQRDLGRRPFEEETAMPPPQPAH